MVEQRDSTPPLTALINPVLMLRMYQDRARIMHFMGRLIEHLQSTPEGTALYQEAEGYVNGLNSSNQSKR